MKKFWPLCTAAVLSVVALPCEAGTIFYVPVSATQSDASCGISSENQYTSAVDGGNARGMDRVINGITLYALPVSGDSSTADNCSLNVLSGSLTNGGGTAANIQADGTLKEVLSDITFNNAASDGSLQEIVLDPESLEAGRTYDLRVYICNAAGQKRLVNLSFVGDGQAAVETGFFNEDDARTSPGGFKQANQVYYIDYRFTWDGDSTPGVTITQKAGNVPFVLYALTNQVVPGSASEGKAAQGEGITAGLVNAESDEVGISSDDFYSSESLNDHGRWIKLEHWGNCWQPLNVPRGWAPYTNGTWRECDDCGWTFVSDEPWAWACYHYGRWTRVKTGCGWAWVPGKVWAASWVSWRRGDDEHRSSCIGWAPLPPEAACTVNVGISSWVDYRYDIGPDYYIFVSLRDFGSDSYFGRGCIFDPARNVIIIRGTINITNIFFGGNITYCGGPDFRWCNERIRQLGGRELTKVSIVRFDDARKLNGKYHVQQGDQLALLSPRIRGEKNPKHNPKIAETLKKDAIDHGWNQVKDPKLKKELKKHLAEEGQGKDRKFDKATLPPDVAEKVAKHGGHNAGWQGPIATGGTDTGVAGGLAPAGGDQHPGKGHKGKNSLGTDNAGVGTQTNVGATGTGLGGGPHHPGQSLKKVKNAQGETTGGDGSQHSGKGHGKKSRTSSETSGGSVQGGTPSGDHTTLGSSGGKGHKKPLHGTQGADVSGGANQATGVQSGNNSESSGPGGTATGNHRKLQGSTGSQGGKTTNGQLPQHGKGNRKPTPTPTPH
jgi:hypothetical protein